MGDVMEVLFVSDTAENNQLSCSAWDYRTGTNMMNYKGAGSLGEQSFSILDAHYILAASSTKPLLYVWPLNSQELMSSIRFVMPGRVNAFAVSPDGLYLVAAIQENFYVWHLNSGRMLNTISKHYQTINCIRFTDDSSHFVTAGCDGSVLVWNLTKILCKEENCENPLYSFTEHGLPVTDIFVGKGGMASFLYTVSLDRTCKVYDLSNGTLLLNVVFTEALHSIVVNAMETNVYVGTDDGNIYEVHVDSLPRSKECNVAQDHSNKFLGHNKGTKVNCLTLSLDSQTLISAGQDEHVYIWHIPSRQLIKKMLFKGQITNLKLRLTNPNIFQPDYKPQQFFFNNLKRMVESPEADENGVVEIMVTELSATNKQRIPNHIIYNSQPSSTTLSKDSPNHLEKIAQLEEEIERLKQVNKELFTVSAKHILRMNQRKLNQSDDIEK